MLIKFKKPDPRAGNTVRMDSHRGQHFVDIGAADLVDERAVAGKVPAAALPPPPASAGAPKRAATKAGRTAPNKAATAEPAPAGAALEPTGSAAAPSTAPAAGGAGFDSEGGPALALDAVDTAANKDSTAGGADPLESVPSETNPG